jgi:glycosyltransferase involved in cell wall biosynthesis
LKIENLKLKNEGPMVSVLIPTFNRPRYLSEALASVLQQSYTNLQIIVVNDGGQDVSDVIRSYDDPRLIFINRAENRGKAYSLNEALARAEGKYIAYLDDDDLYYSNHIEILVNALESQTDCRVAYSDLYKTYCNIMPDGSRQVLSKVVDISRDFDRFFMLHFNHTLHVCLMHHRDLIEKTGPYNERLNVLIDWDMTRRLVFFSDFHHVHQITGEFYSPAGPCDRISVQRRKDRNEYIRNVLEIRTTRPPKPWPKIEDMSIILVAGQLNEQVGEAIGLIWQHTFYPYKLFLPLPQIDLARLNTDMPNMVLVPVDPSSSQSQRIDAALAKCDGEYIVIVPSGLPIEDMWVENSLYALINNSASREGFELAPHQLSPGAERNRAGRAEFITPSLSIGAGWAAVLRKDDLQYARKNFPALSTEQSLKAVGITLRQPSVEELPFQFDHLLQLALSAEKDGKWAEAARLYEYIAQCHQNELWMKTQAAKAFFKAGDHNRAAELSCQVNQQRPTVDTLLLEARAKRNKDNFHSAIDLLRRAEQILVGAADYPALAKTGRCST